MAALILKFYKNNHKYVLENSPVTIKFGSESIKMCKEYVRAFTNLHINEQPVTITFENENDSAAKILIQFLATSDRLDCKDLISTFSAWSLVQEKLNLKFGLHSPKSTLNIKDAELVQSIGIVALVIQRAKFLVDDFFSYNQDPFEKLALSVYSKGATTEFINKEHPLAVWCIGVLKATKVEEVPDFPFGSVSEKQARDFAESTKNTLVKKLLAKENLPWKKSTATVKP